MNLTAEEKALRAGECGEAAQWAIEHQIKVGDYLGARDFVPVTQAHIMADTESLGEAGVEWLERLARMPAQARRVRIPTITDPRGTDFAAAERLKQQPWMLELERRAIAAFEALGVLMTNTCINYQTIMAPVLGEHVAYGDTGVVIYGNSVCGAPSKFERVPSSDEMKHFGAALASYGSVALFHMAGITPEARRLDDVLAPGSTVPSHEIGEADIRAFQQRYAQAIDSVDVVVFSAPQLSLLEMAQVAGLLAGRQARIPLLVVTSPQVKSDADRLGLTARIEAAGAIVLAGMCFYQSYAREIAEANGWRRLATNSAKLVNIIGGYGYRPALMSMQACIDVACNGGKL